jgi:hypothetical protein
MTSHTLPTTAPTRSQSLRDPAFQASGLLRTAFTVVARVAPAFRRSSLGASNGSAS